MILLCETTYLLHLAWFVFKLYPYHTIEQSEFPKLYKLVMKYI